MRTRIGFLVLLLAVSCSSPEIRRVEQTTELNKEIPSELLAKFAIDDSESTKAVGKSALPKRTAKMTARPAVDPLRVGEKLTYRVSFFGVSAGNFFLEVLPFKTISGRKVYHLRARAESNRFFSMFYRLNDVIESYMDYEGLFSHRFHMLLDETKQSRNLVELYDSSKKKAFVWDRLSKENEPFKETKQYFDMEPFSQDSLSSIYYARMVPLTDKKIYQFNMLSGGKGSTTAIYVERREKMQTIFGETDTVVVRPEPNFKGALKKEGESFMWYTDDDRRILLKVEAILKVGKILAVLEKAELGEE